jgi:3'(2'),5'-bisphosphate nucleotidase
MRVYGGSCAVWEKADRSPITEADEDAEAIVLAGLARVAPAVPVVAEESASRGVLPMIGREFILVDALDGTREFLKKNNEFTVNIAFVRDEVPCCGVVFAPALGKLWLGSDRAELATVWVGQPLPPPEQRAVIKARARPQSGLVALASRSHADPETEAFLAALPIASRRSVGSSVKFCLLAQGEADVYPRFGPTMEWDTAAGDAVLRAAGGRVNDRNGETLRYGKQAGEFRNSSFVAWGAPPTTR